MRLVFGLLTGSVLVTGVSFAAQGSGDAQLRGDTAARPAPEAHVEIARTAAGTSYQNLFTFLCTAPGPGGTSRTSPQRTTTA